MFAHKTNILRQTPTDEFDNRLDKFVRVNRRRTLDLKKNKRIGRQIRDVTDTECNEAAFPGRFMTKLEHIHKAKITTDQWEGSHKTSRTALFVKGGDKIDGIPMLVRTSLMEKRRSVGTISRPHFCTNATVMGMYSVRKKIHLFHQRHMVNFDVHVGKIFGCLDIFAL